MYLDVVYLDAFLQEIDKCLAIMTELNALAVTPIMLIKNPEVVATIKKVSIRRFDILLSKRNVHSNVCFIYEYRI